MTAVILAALAGITAGYALRCWRPCRRAWKWANRVDRRSSPNPRRRPTWWLAQGVFAVSIAVAFVLDPAHVYRLLRYGPPPPPPRSPAVRVARRGEQR